MLKTLEKYHKSINLILLSIIIVTYIFRDLRSIYRSEEYIKYFVNVRNIIGAVMLVLFIINFINRKYSLKTVILIIIALFFYGALSFQTDTSDFMYGLDLLFYTLIIIVSEDINYNIIIKVVFFSFVLSLILVCIRTLINEVQLVIDVSEFSRRVRYSVGYGHGNSGLFACIFNYTCLYYIYIRKDKIQLYEFVLLFILNCVCFYINNTKNSFACVNIVLLASFIFKYNLKCNKFFSIYKYIMYMSVFCAVFLAIALPALYNSSNKFFANFNNLLTGRLKLGNDAINNMHLTLFGQLTDFERTSTNWIYNVVDSSYLRYLITYGIIAFTILIFFMLYFAHLISKKKDLYLFVIFIVMQLRFITDLDLFPVMRYNYFFFIWAYNNSIVYSSSSNRNNKCKDFSRV